MSMETLVTLSTPHNRSGVSHGSLFVATDSDANKQQTKNTTRLHTVCVVSFRCLENATVRFVMKWRL